MEQQTLQEIVSEYKRGNDYKAGIGKLGLNEQVERNERFYCGDQWYGAQIGANRPLVRRNVIKRIGEFKQSAIGGSAPIAVKYSAEGVGDTPATKEIEERMRANFMEGKVEETVSDPEVSLFMEVLSSYFSTTAERLKFDDKKAQILQDAYVYGTGLGYTYWDDSIITGLYADEAKDIPIKGDINFIPIDIRNVVFGEPNNTDLQTQPYIIVSQRRTVDDVKREAKANGISDSIISGITADKTELYNEPEKSQRCTTYIKFYKEYNKDDSFKIMCCKITEKATIKEPWDTGLKMYPFAIMQWMPRANCIYGDSDVTYQIPNQIAINRALTATIWALMSTGMPKTVVNADLVTQKVTNNPGEVIKIYGDSAEVNKAISYIAPPNIGAPLLNAVDNLTSSTLADNGANDAALGDFRPDNAAAIIQNREATLQPLLIYQSRFYSFVEDVSRIWADFWMSFYGERKLKIRNDEGVYFVPIDPERYKDMLITAKIDVGASPMWSKSAVMLSLDKLLQAQVIDVVQYLEAAPEGMIPNRNKLLESAKEKMAEMQALQQAQMMAAQPTEQPMAQPTEQLEEVEMIEE